MKDRYKYVDKLIFLKVPVINTKPESVPLSSIDTLVFAYLQHRLRKNGGATLSTVAKSLRLDRASSKRSLGLLVGLGLAVLEEKQFKATEPLQPAKEWFQTQKNANGQWFEQLVYDRVFLPRTSSTLTIRTNLLFWHLVRLGEEVRGMPDCLQVGNSGKKYPRYLTDTYLAKAIRCERKTIRSGLKRLSDLGLIQCRKRAKGFAVAISSLKDHVGLWRDKWNKKKVVNQPPLSVKELFGVPSSAVSEPESSPLNGILKRLRGYGVKGKLAEELVALIMDNEIPPGEWMSRLKQASEDQKANNEAGKSKGEHCGYLFRYMIREYVKQMELQREGNPVTHYQTAEEMFMKNALGGLRMTGEAKALLNIAIKKESLPFEDGRSIPCPISHQSVTQAAKDARDNWSDFKARILAQVFNGTLEEAKGCVWIEMWMTAEQEEPLPQPDNSPLKALGLNIGQCDAVRDRVRMWWGSADTAHAIRRADMIVKIAAWQSGQCKAKHSWDRVTQAVEHLREAMERSAIEEDDEVPSEDTYSVIPQRIIDLGNLWKERCKNPSVA